MKRGSISSLAAGNQSSSTELAQLGTLAAGQLSMSAAVGGEGDTLLPARRETTDEDHYDPITPASSRCGREVAPDLVRAFDSTDCGRFAA